MGTAVRVHLATCFRNLTPRRNVLDVPGTERAPDLQVCHSRRSLSCSQNRRQVPAPLQALPRNHRIRDKESMLILLRAPHGDHPYNGHSSRGTR